MRRRVTSVSVLWMIFKPHYARTMVIGGWPIPTSVRFGLVDLVIAKGRLVLAKAQIAQPLGDINRYRPSLHSRSPGPDPVGHRYPGALVLRKRSRGRQGPAAARFCGSFGPNEGPVNRTATRQASEAP